ncbi:cytochrome c biogenesis protein [Pyrobaculum calidifontis]|uniref:Cytochrome c biogenesis protein, transmembrane region n=1 Tax=Pyrobaculum calidifontis (strain DSM 21063 / JCM 11548 / VA1) TaxID=410359 RepID=A3MTK0_PYRCJ|nr:cytochrome c biogenesis protein [Pyrobaculum calidifontis]ABO07967.1 cytochrome c biogenesis protein, transmembrane region [Pyrobaculum calidifontis JCM 11548]
MRTLLAVLAAAFLAYSLTIGQLHFTDVNSGDDFNRALVDGPVLIFIHQPNCLGCAKLKGEVFPKPQVAQALRGVNLVSIDLAAYPVTSIKVVADGSVYVYQGSLRVSKASGQVEVPIYATPTLVLGYVKNGTIHLTMVIVGAVEAPQLIELVKLAYTQPTEATPRPSTTQTAEPTTATQTTSPLGTVAQIALSFAAGAASVFSPCVLPVVTIAATTYLARRNLALVLLGMVISFAALAALATTAAAWARAAATTALYLIGGVVLVAIGLIFVIERFNKAFLMWVSSLQTRAYKLTKRGAGAVGDLALGASLGAVWMPCVAPFLGVVAMGSLVAAALSRDYLAVFFNTLAYAAGLAAVIYAVVYAVQKSARRTATLKWSRLGRRIEYAVGIASIVLGILLIGEAFGLRTITLLV